MKIQTIVQKVSMGLALTLVAVAMGREVMIINDRSAKFDDGETSEAHMTLPPLPIPPGHTPASPTTPD